MADLPVVSGTKVFISNIAVADTVDTLSEFQALSFTEVTGVENIGEFGDSSPILKGMVIGDGRTHKGKGARDAGEQDIVCFRKPTDAGQVLMESAEQTPYRYAFKFVLPDAATPSFSNSTIYYRGLVATRRNRQGANDDFLRRTFTIAIDSELFPDTSHAI